MIKQYLFLKRNRLRKKILLYKRAFLLTFDWTMMIYISLSIVYVLFAIINAGTPVETLRNIAEKIPRVDEDTIYFILGSVPLYYMLRSFRHPGVVFSSGEFLLTILPNKRTAIWFITFIERLLKMGLMCIVVGAIIHLMFLFSLSQIVTYMALLFFINLLMTSVEWYLFQTDVRTKIIFTIGFILAINGFYFAFEAHVVIAIILVGLLVINWLVHPRAFKKVDWKKVTAVGDYSVWNMLLISRLTGVSFKRERSYSVWQRMKWWRQRFLYEKETVYHRLWLLYFEQHFVILLQLFGALFVFQFVMLFLNKTFFLLAVVISIHIFTTFLTSLFISRFHTGIVHVLPLDIKTFQRTFLSWVLPIVLLLMIPFIVYLSFTSVGVALVLFVVVSVTYLYALLNKLRDSVNTLDKTFSSHKFWQFSYFLLLLTIIVSDAYPFVLIFGVGLLIWLFPVRAVLGK